MTTWQDQAACRDSDDAEVFFYPGAEEEAKTICATCPVMLTCREAHLAEPYGVFGGLDEQERQVLFFARPAPEKEQPSDQPCTMAELMPGADKFMPNHPNAYLLIRKMIRQYKDGQGFDTIAEALGVSHTTVEKYVREAGIKRTQVQAAELKLGYSDTIKREILTRYTAGQGPRTISRDLRIGRRFIERIVREAGVSRSRSEAIRLSHPRSSKELVS